MRILLSFLLLAGLTPQLAAGLVDPQNLVIENVYIAAESAEDAPISLLIRDNKLELLTKDDIPVPDGFVALDANGGYLVGNLVLGESPSLMILDADPRTDFEALLNHKSHSVFVIHNGELRRNSLQYAKDMFEPQIDTARWHAYTPPPVALPTHYEGEPWNHWTTENTSNTFFSVLALDRQYWLSQNDESTQQVGDLGPYEGGEIRDWRFGLLGTLNYFDKPWGYNVVLATNAFDNRFVVDNQDEFRFIDYRLDIPMGEGVKLSIGKQKEPISMERIMTLINLPMQERSSVADAFLPSRNFGIHLSGNALAHRMTWAAGVFNDFIDSSVSIDEGATSVVGRLSWLAFVSEDRSNLVHLSWAGRYENGNQGFLYRTTPEFNNAPVFVDTGAGTADEISQYDLEVSWRRGPFWLSGEYVGTHVDSPTLGPLDFSGYNITGSWIITGEMRDYRPKSGTFGPVPVSRSVYQNGWGAMELASRWSSIDLTDGPVQGGEMDIFSLGLTWWLSSILNVSLNYRYITYDKDSLLQGEVSGVNARLLLKLN
jgi:phosphate-selective porin OprO/OprP